MRNANIYNNPSMKEDGDNNEADGGGGGGAANEFKTSKIQKNGKFKSNTESFLIENQP